MEDRYLFKAKSLDWREFPEKEQWIAGYYVSGFDEYEQPVHLIFEPPSMFFSHGETDGWIEIDTSTICQCTGLKDKNGKLIWENDILVGHLDDNYPQNATYEMVLWNKSGFCTKEQGSNDISELGEFDQKNFEVCGNIIDNPELFESEDNMTESEAIEWIKELRDSEEIREFYYVENFIKACDMAIQALEKQIPKKPVKSEKQVIRYVNTYECPICNLKFTGTGIAKWCYHCGQKLDWSNEE